MLPDFLVPYKRHVSATIEQLITTEQRQSVACEHSTLRKTINWFKHFIGYFIAATKSRQIRHPLSDDSPIESRADLLAKPGWLRMLAISLANFELWPRKRLTE
jgi:hypothetical protein